MELTFFNIADDLFPVFTMAVYFHQVISLLKNLTVNSRQSQDEFSNSQPSIQKLAYAYPRCLYHLSKTTFLTQTHTQLKHYWTSVSRKDDSLSHSWTSPKHKLFPFQKPCLLLSRVLSCSLLHSCCLVQCLAQSRTLNKYFMSELSKLFYFLTSVFAEGIYWELGKWWRFTNVIFCCLSPSYLKGYVFSNMALTFYLLNIKDFKCIYGYGKKIRNVIWLLLFVLFCLSVIFNFLLWILNKKKFKEYYCIL